MQAIRQVYAETFWRGEVVQEALAALLLIPKKNSKSELLLYLVMPHKAKVFRGTQESVCLSVLVLICVSVCTCAYKTYFYQSTGGGIKTHSVTALVFIIELPYSERKIIATTSVRCMCVRACVRLCVWICLEYNFYIYQWISK